MRSFDLPRGWGLDTRGWNGQNYGRHGASATIHSGLRFRGHEAPFGATWEIRFGPGNRFRVLYDIDEEPRVVRIMAIGEKQRERLFVGGEEVQL